jgi:hypothetical protein
VVPVGLSQEADGLRVWDVERGPLLKDDAFDVAGPKGFKGKSVDDRGGNGGCSVEVGQGKDLGQMVGDVEFGRHKAGEVIFGFRQEGEEGLLCFGGLCFFALSQKALKMERIFYELIFFVRAEVMGDAGVPIEEVQMVRMSFKSQNATGFCVRDRIAIGFKVDEGLGCGVNGSNDGGVVGFFWEWVKVLFFNREEIVWALVGGGVDSGVGFLITPKASVFLDLS